MLLTRGMLDTVDVDVLPDDYGIDIALTLHALTRGRRIDQVVVPFPDHEAGSNSRVIMENVAGVILAALAQQPTVDRRDVMWPDRWWTAHNPPTATSRPRRSLLDHSLAADQLGRAQTLLEAPADEVRDVWCEHLALAGRSARAGRPIAPLVAALIVPFLVHAESRRGLDLDLDAAETYVLDLGTRLAGVAS
jgi:hypothetical protein